MLGAIDEVGRPTSLGREINELPLHPRLGRMVVLGGRRSPQHQLLAALLAVLLEDRDVLRGRSDELPADLGLRLGLLIDRHRNHPAADGRAIQGARRRASELARRVGLGLDPSDLDQRLLDSAGSLLALAYPDRIAVARTGAGRFQLRSGTTAWVAKDDVLATAGALVVADLDGGRKEARIRLAAGLDPQELEVMFGEALETRRTIEWDRERDELVERTERRLGGVVLESSSTKPESGDEVTSALLARVRDRGLAALRWTPAATRLASRVTFLHRQGPPLSDEWPDWSEPALLEGLEEWLAPFLMFARGRADLEAVDVLAALGARLDHRRRTELDRLAPESYTLPSGRTMHLDYDGEAPVLAVRVQELYGVTVHPSIAGGRVPLVLQLLSPAQRPIQITSDLPGFWAGSWREVRKEMAGRYPKHDWPERPELGPGRGR
ncbi:MAG: ATP-dependent helicase C-terminal domain-containing protein [Ilumatobacteraceae bacterium]